MHATGGTQMATHLKNSTIPHAPTDATDDIYPDTDGKPMAVSDKHRFWLISTKY